MAESCPPAPKSSWEKPKALKRASRHNRFITFLIARPLSPDRTCVERLRRQAPIIRANTKYVFSFPRPQPHDSVPSRKRTSDIGWLSSWITRFILRPQLTGALRTPGLLEALFARDR